MDLLTDEDRDAALDAATDRLVELFADVRNPWHHDFRCAPHPLFLEDPAEWHRQQRAFVEEALELMKCFRVLPPPGIARNIVLYPDLLRVFLDLPRLRIREDDWAAMLERCLEYDEEPQPWMAPSLALLLAAYKARPEILVRRLPGMELPKLLVPKRRVVPELYQQARAAGFPDIYLEGERPYALPGPISSQDDADDLGLVGLFRAAYHRARHDPSYQCSEEDDPTVQQAVREARSGASGAGR